MLFTFFCYGAVQAQQSGSLISKELPFTIKNSELDNYFFKGQRSLFLAPPENVKNVFTYDPETNTYILTQKMGEVDYRHPTIFSYEEYQEFTSKQNLFEFWKNKSQSSTSSVRDGIIPPIYIGGDLFENIFGSNFIDIRPQGSAELTFGVLSNHRKDETLDVRRRKTTSFDFNEKIQMSVVAKIGEKIEFKTNYNTESTLKIICR